MKHGPGDAASDLSVRYVRSSRSSSRRRGRTFCTPWCASARPSAPSRSSPVSANPDRDRLQTRVVTAVLWLAEDDPTAAAAVLAPVLDGSAPVHPRVWLAHAFLLEAIARDALGDEGQARHPPAS